MNQQPTSLDLYRASLGTVHPLTMAEEHELAYQWQAGVEEAATRLIKSCLPFVIYVAREYRRWGIPLEDLVQQGNLGLLKAVKKFEPSKECRLITYAAYWIRAEIRDYVVRGYRIVRLGSTRTERRAIRLFRREGVASVEELAEKSGMPMRRAKKLWPLLTRGDSSLDIPGPEPTHTNNSNVNNNSHETPETLTARQEQISAVKKALVPALRDLTERERRIVEVRMMSDEPYTLEKIGREMGVSKERVRQLEVRAKTKLRGHLAAFQHAA